MLKEEIPTNNAGSGNIQGIGVGPNGEPGVRKVILKKLLSRIKGKNERKKECH